MEFAILAIGVVAVPYIAIALPRWRMSFVGLLVFMPFAGMLALWLHPFDWIKLAKDIAFVIPAYLGYFLFRAGDREPAGIGIGLLVTVALFSAVVVLQAANPSIGSLLVAAVGIKVWLMYVPLIFLAASHLRSEADVHRIMRLLLAVALVPCVVGLIQRGLAETIGIGATMRLFYGEAGVGATQGLQTFDYGGNLYRIPSTFSFVAQYSYFTLAMLAPAYATAVADPDVRWRFAGRIGMLVILIAGMLSGARGNILLAPMILGLAVVLDGRLSTALALAVFLPVAAVGGLMAAGIDPLRLLIGATELAERYSQSHMVTGLVDAIERHPFGLGTGMGSLVSRHVAAGVRLAVYENLWAKAVAELGVIGFVLFMVMLLVVLAHGFSALQRAPANLRSAAAALFACLAVFAATSGKGYALEIDPMNVYFWVFAGFLLKLPLLRPQPVYRPAVMAAGARGYAYR
ncbi:MAG: hypothetical protein AB7O45_01485 [Alphaproteobacteria bacterium]